MFSYRKTTRSHAIAKVITGSNTASGERFSSIAASRAYVAADSLRFHNGHVSVRTERKQFIRRVAFDQPRAAPRIRQSDLMD